MCGPKAAGGSISYINFPLVPQISLKLSVRETTLSQLWSPDQSLLWPPSSLLLPRVPSHTSSRWWRAQLPDLAIPISMTWTKPAQDGVRGATTTSPHPL